MRSHRFIALAAFLLVFTVPSVSLSETHTEAKQYTYEEVTERLAEIGAKYAREAKTKNLTTEEIDEKLAEIGTKYDSKIEALNSTAGDKFSENTSQETSGNTSQETSKNTSQETSKNTSQETSKNTSQETSENTENKSVKGSTTGQSKGSTTRQGKGSTTRQGKNRKGGGKRLDEKQEITPKPAPATVELTGLPLQAEYRITKWDINGNITLEIQPKDGQKVPTAEGNPAVLKGRVVSLRAPIEFTLPNGVEVVQIDLDPANNYKILDDGSLGELKKFQGRDERGNIHSDRATNPGDSVLMLLMLNKGVMTVLRLPY